MLTTWHFPMRVALSAWTVAVLASNSVAGVEPDATVSARTVPLTFNVNSAAVNEDGTLIVVVRNAPITDSRRDLWKFANAYSQLAVIDIAKGEIVYERGLNFSAGQVLVVGDQMLIANHLGVGVHVVGFDGKDREIATSGQVRELSLIGGHVVIDTFYDRIVLDAATLAPGAVVESGGDERVLPGAVVGSGGDERMLPGALQDVESFLRIDGIVRGSFQSEVMLIGQEWSIDRVPEPLTNQLSPFPAPDRNRRSAQRWGTRLIPGAVVDSSGHTVCDRRATGDGLLLTRHPHAVFTIDTRKESRKRDMTYAASVELVELASGASRWIKIKPSENISRQEYELASPWLWPEVFETASGLAVVQGARVHLVSDEQLGLAAGPLPLYFVPKQSQLVAEINTPVTLTYETCGGTGPITYSLGPTLDGIRIDPVTGTVKIDPEQFSAEYLADAIVGQPSKLWNLPVRIRDMAESPKLLDWRRTLRMQLGDLAGTAGINVDGVPIGIRIEVRATDANQQEAVLAHTLVFDVPTDLLDKTFLKHRPEGWQPLRLTAAPESAMVADETKQLREEVEALKAEVERLQRMLEQRGK